MALVGGAFFDVDDDAVAIATSFLPPLPYC
jgi:hypothetical protein